MSVNSVLATRMSIHNQDGNKVAEFFATSSGKTVHKSDIKEFTKELKKVASGLAKIKDGKLPFSSEYAVRNDVAKALIRCVSMSQKIEGNFQKTTYRHNPKKLKQFSAAQEKLVDLQRQAKSVKKQDVFRADQSARHEEAQVINAEQRAGRRELLKNNPDANFNGGMVR
ncbi:hypothetical protein QZM52_26065 [Burkholderia metallica]|uniref:Uncharacterized protein n=1 Tax=Burkholderia metallica TaxID=488729 RepID=A0ABT8PI56_9BURK|nr:hypothetical protein [Burkholderia metallica]MDN7934748.1 hypothetical protein [Burkholderia metallica]